MKKIITIIIFLMSLNVFAKQFVVHIPKNQAKYNQNISNIDTSIQAWKKVSSSYDLSNFTPIIADGSTAANAIYYVNFGQIPFKGNSYGFKPFDLNYSESKWTNSSFKTDGSFVLPTNMSYSRYEEYKSSGKYYFEVEIKTKPYADTIGFKDKDVTGSYGYSYTIGVMRVGYHTEGMQWRKEGDIVDGYWLPSGKQDVGTILQVWIYYDKNLISIMELGTEKNDYVNYIGYE